MSSPSAERPAPILVADSTSAFESVQECLGPEFPLVQVPTVERARSLLHAATPLVLCGAHFDEGRMYELLRFLKSSPGLAQVPFVVTRIEPGELDDALYQGVKVASAALGGNGFVDLFGWQVRYGQEEAARRLAERVRALVD